jgi:hypothetical protein
MVGRRGFAALASGLAALLLTQQAGAQAGLAPPPTAADVAHRAPAALALAIEAPQVMVLGRDDHAVVRFSAPDDAHVHLYANIGSLGTPTRVADARYEVRYTPPEEKYPQVAILALISGDASRVAWTQIALHGAARVELRSDPEVSVEVHVGDAAFGPVKTDRDGRAVIPVIVPPGTVDALSIATDALGNQRQHVIPIEVPEFQRLLSVCSSQDARGFWVFAVDTHGAPQQDARLDLDAAPLRVSGSRAAAPGVYRVALQIPDEVRAGTAAQLRAKLHDQTVSQPACEIHVELEHAERIALHMSGPSDAPPDQAAQPIRMRVTPQYRGARPAEAAEFEFSATSGRVEPMRARSSGPIDVLWWLPSTATDRSEAVFTARSGALSATQTIALPGSAGQRGSTLDMGGLFVALQVGVISNFAKITAPLVSLRIGHSLPFISEHLQLALECGYYQSQHRDESSDALDQVRSDVRVVPTWLRLAYQVPVGGFAFGPFAGGGVAVALTEVSSGSTGTARASEVVPLWAAGGSATRALGLGRLALELGYSGARVNLPSATGNAAGFFATLGYSLGQ